VVTHDTRVFHHADAIAHMDDGRIVKTESNHEKEIEIPEFQEAVPMLASRMEEI
jgi:ABC-type siderophore export system fused ATPase/permease subunit